MQTPNLPKSICADAVEAIIGAICLDGGPESVAEVVERLFLREARGTAKGLPALDPKSHLQAILQAHGIPLPSYELLSVKGPSHMPVFEVRLRVNGIECTATGKTRKGAESVAASEMLQQLQTLVFSETPVIKPEPTKNDAEGASPILTAAVAPLAATVDEILSPSTPSTVVSPAVTPIVTPAEASSGPSTGALITAQIIPDMPDDSEDFEPQPTPEALQRGLSQYASNLASDPALRKPPRGPNRVTPDREPESDKNVAPHPVLTQSDLRRIVQMAHKGAE